MSQSYEIGSVDALVALADSFVAVAPKAAVYCTVQGCTMGETVDPEEEEVSRIALRLHVLYSHKSLLLSSEPDILGP